MTLTEFLLARVAEDEAVAERVYLWSGAGLDDFDELGDRVLAECEAKRRIVEEHAPAEHNPALCGTCVVWADQYEASGIYLPCLTLQLLALPYADHPDYDKEWKS
ncbi:MAG: hypothetical protein JWP74_1745 [Marmoricola sp.]|nr:hypothetical protein [Marmoricola sp.]